MSVVAGAGPCHGRSDCSERNSRTFNQVGVCTLARCLPTGSLPACLPACLTDCLTAPLPPSMPPSLPPSFTPCLPPSVHVSPSILRMHFSGARVWMPCGCRRLRSASERLHTQAAGCLLNVMGNAKVGVKAQVTKAYASLSHCVAGSMSLGGYTVQCHSLSCRL